MLKHALSREVRVESRWPPVITVLVVLTLIQLLPGRYRVAPPWVPIALTLAMLTTMVAVIVAKDKRRWIVIERASIFTFAVFAVALVYLSLWRLLSAIIYHTEHILPTTLLASAVALWLVNIAVSGLVYWQMDRGGPEGRAGTHRLSRFLVSARRR